MALMRSQAPIMRTTALFAALVETEWLQRQCLPLLTRAEAVLVVLVAVEAGFESLRRDKSAFPPLSTEALVRLAAEHGRWRVVQHLQRSCRPVKHPFYIDLGDEEALGPIGDVDFAQCLWIQRHHPLAFSASVVYAAVRRGCLEQVKWLDRFVEYDVNLAIPIAAQAGQVDVLQWLLDNQKPIKKHFWFPPPRFEVVMRRADTFLDGINWFDTKTQTTNSFLVTYGLLPPSRPSSFHKRYPFMDWAAERGDLPLLQRLHEDPDLKRTCSYCAMQSAAEHGDLEMIQWLHTNRREHRNLMVHVLQKAAEHGHVHILAWFEANGLMPRSSASIFRETARAGQVEALRWLFGHLDDAALHPPELTYYAARSGRVDMVKYIHEELDIAVTSQGVYSAAQKGHDEVVQWLLEHDQEQVFSTDDYYDMLLKAAADNGNLLLVKKCVEEYGVWSRYAAEPAVTKGHVSILDYLHSKALERATSAGTSLEDEISYSSVDLPAMLKSGKCDDIVLWVLKHTSEEDQLDKLDDISSLVAQNVPSWNFTRQYMLLRPRQSRKIRLLPQWAIQLGSLSDLQTLEAMQHPKLFTKRTLRIALTTDHLTRMACSDEQRIFLSSQAIFVNLIDDLTIFFLPTWTFRMAILPLLDADWFQRQLRPLLTRDDVVHVVLVAVEAGFESLRRDKSAFSPVSNEELLQVAAKHGKWDLVLRLQRFCRQMKRQFKAHLDGEKTLGLHNDVVLAQCQWIQRHHPVEFTSVVMYTAVKRGKIEEVKWLHRYIDYEVGDTIQIAAKACHLDVVEWLLDHHRSASKRNPIQDETTTRYEVLLRREDSFLDALSWSDNVSKTTNFISPIEGLLPPRLAGPFSKQYPLMDWAAEKGDLHLLQRLHGDAKFNLAYSDHAMRLAASHGHVEVINWLHEHRQTQENDYAGAVHAAVVAGHLAVLDWFHTNGLVPRSLRDSFEDATLAGQLRVVQWLFEYYDDPAIRPRYLAYPAVRSGSLDMVRYICQEQGYGVMEMGIHAAAKRGNYDIVQWMIEYDREHGLSTSSSYAMLLDSAAEGGNLEVVKWCVEELGAWSRGTASTTAALAGHVQVLEYLYTKAQERAVLHGTSLQEQLSCPYLRLVEMLKAGVGDEAILWVLKHASDEERGWLVTDKPAFVQLCTSDSPNAPSWRVMQQLMTYMPELCCEIDLYPLWAVLYGTLSDCQALEDIQHPKLFNMSTLNHLLEHSRDDVSMTWFVARCDSRLLDVRVASWAAKYGAVTLLPVVVEKLLVQGEDLLQVFGTVIWSAVKHDQVSVLDWMSRQAYLRELKEQLWRFSLAERAARLGHMRSLLWLHQHQKVDRQQMDVLAGVAAQWGQLQCLKGLYTAQGVKCTITDVVKAARRGHADVVKYILHQQPSTQPIGKEERLEVDGVRYHYELFMAQVCSSTR
ncbi:hypothetical protein Poli38472_010130 [Pythium oligandrum]|uniref:Uncharacterized protein n=1 Tax=Pythium oligandrum TaxID=41045 RepID=A0A8K1C8X1_PYTOL|nr:hypothetical protein Poli38472_010130 [Pythium oligandrum]|eukprot:TMW58571.1 hypothetical protein Poli38472_010130 [Pythium oligandrum]